VAAAAAVSFTVHEGLLAGVLVLSAVVVAGDLFRRVLMAAGPVLFWRDEGGARALAAFYALFASGALLVSRAGGNPFGQREPIIELTAVHYLFAGAAALMLARATGRRLAIVLTAAAPPLVAFGFVSELAVPQVGGAVLMTLGVWATASFELRSAFDPNLHRVARVLLVVSGIAIWVPMILAVAWAAGQHWSIPILSIPDMARTHGIANALGFVLCGLVARRVQERAVVAS
jgi:hypothetical protein